MLKDDGGEGFCHSSRRVVLGVDASGIGIVLFLGAPLAVDLVVAVAVAVVVAVAAAPSLKRHLKRHCTARLGSGRSIYPDEFDNFVERMEVISDKKSKKYPFELDVITPLLDVVLDTSLGAEVSRSR